MYDPLGLSIGTTNFVAVRAGEPPVTRRSLLTLFPDRAPQVGAPAEHPEVTEAGLLIDGFVERVGEQVPLVATDGSAHQPDLLLVDAIDAVVDATGAAVSQVAIAVPAYWPAATRQALQDALQTHAGVSMRSAPPYLVPDAVAALSALHADRGVASRGVVALLDFGGGGTSITLADAASGFQPIGETLRYPQFSGDRVDQAMLTYIVGSADRGDDSEPGGTTAVGDLAQLTEECRQAKERLSTQTATELVVELPAYHTRIALTRAEFEDLIRDPLDGAVAALEGLLQRNKIDWRDLAAVATVGGGANIPLIADRLSARCRVPVVTTARPALTSAVGAALCAARGAGEIKEAAPTTMAAAVTSAGTTADLPANAPDSQAPHDLAWSQEEIGADAEPLPFVGEPYRNDPPVRRDPPAAPQPSRRRSSRLPQLVFGLGALVAMIAVGGVTYTLAGASRDKSPARPTSSATVAVAPPSSKLPAPAPVAPPPSPVASPVTPAAPPPPPPVTTSTPPPPPTTTTPPPTTTTTTPPPTTTTTAPSTTAPSTTAPSTTAATPPPSTSTEATGDVPMTTEYLRIPLVPMPIPVQVPEN